MLLSHNRLLAALCLLCCGLVIADPGRAQGPGGGRPGGQGSIGGIGGPRGAGGMDGRNGMPGVRGAGNPGDRSAGNPGGTGPASPNAPGNGGTGNIPGSGNRNPLQHGPGGRWWDERKYARSVGLTGDQQRRMDSVFLENRNSLVNGLDNLRRAQTRLEAASKTDHPNEAAVLAEIQNVAQARADLEKANTHMLLQLRNEMTQEQLNKLERLK